MTFYITAPIIAYNWRSYIKSHECIAILGSENAIVNMISLNN